MRKRLAQRAARLGVALRARFDLPTNLAIAAAVFLTHAAGQVYAPAGPGLLGVLCLGGAIRIATARAERRRREIGQP